MIITKMKLINKITSVEDAKEAITTGKIAKEKAEFIAQALNEIKNNDEEITSKFSVERKISVVHYEPEWPPYEQREQ